MIDKTQQSSLREQATSHSITLGEAFWVWVKVALNSFGGPAGQIAVMHRILVEEKRWVSENRFLHALNYCMLLPGPEAQQLAIYIGWLLHKAIGGIIAGVLFVLPGFVAILGLSILYAGFQDVSLVQAIFFGLKPAVMAVVLHAVFRIGQRALKNNVMIGIAAAAFVAIFFLNVPFPLIVLGAGLLGYIGGKLWTEKFYVIKGHGSEGNDSTTTDSVAIADSAATSIRPSFARSIQVATICLALWFGPLILLVVILGRTHVFVVEGMFFSQAAVVTFGGAYAVLTYIAQQAVETYGWLQPGEMLDGLGMAETTPGPLIQVVQFVGFMGAYRNPGTLDPMVAGVLGSILVTWVTFVPCFLWIFLGAPYIEYLRGKTSLTTMLSSITAAVVGVILNLAVWFSIHTIFEIVDEVHVTGIRLLIPDWQTIDLAALLIAVGAFVAIFRYKVDMLLTLASSAIAGLVYFLVFRSATG
jgi:chromate transporter